MEFTWDEAKRRQNLEKHGIDFADTKIIFSHPVLTKRDTRRDYQEERWAALGQLRGMVVFVAYTLRSDTVRIISIRRANK
ncbi:MAG: BrnT family toxin, partial [Desulfobaccales bacterium]